MNTIFLQILQQAFFGLILFSLIFSVDWAIRKLSLNQWRSFLWTCFFAFLFIPVQWVVKMVFPPQSLPPVVLEIPMNQNFAPIARKLSSVPVWGWMDYALLIWAIGSIASFLVFIIVPMIRETRMHRSLQGEALRLGDHGPHELVVVKQDILPFVAGFFRSRIYISKRLIKHLDMDQLASVMLHEKAHIYHGDIYKILLARVIICFFWFCPYVYWAYFKMREAQEYVADQYSLLRNKNITPKEYGQILLKLSLLLDQESWGAFGVSILNKSHLRRRLEAMKYFNPKRKTSYVFPALIASLICLASITAVSFESDTQQEIEISESREETGKKNLFTISAIVRDKTGEIVARPTMVAEATKKASIVMKNDEGGHALNMMAFDEGNMVRIEGMMCEGLVQKATDIDHSDWKMKNHICDSKSSFEFVIKSGESISLHGKSHTYEFSVFRGAHMEKVAKQFDEVNGNKIRSASSRVSDPEPSQRMQKFRVRN